ncbi:MAG: tripartite tricarboxylate transporter substrate binding protein [Burkholderiales bacterium]|nr:tripartite tricarboxylate transporter substrate binding protein [Burkholderiales bacterium]
MYSSARELSRLILLALLVAASAGQAYAQSFPSRPVRIVVGYSTGGPYDAISRTIGQKMAEFLGHPVIIDFRPGAAGAIGADHVARAAADGYTMLFMGSAFMIAPSVAKLPYDTIKDFASVGQVATGYTLLVTNPALPVRSVKELIALAKRHPGKLTYASSGSGGPLHLFAELFKADTGIDMLHVPYKGAGPAMTDVIGGHVDLMFIGITAAVPHLKSGKLRGLAISADQRVAKLPDVPTMTEAGLPKSETDPAIGLLVPAATPKEIITVLNGALVKALQTPDIKQRFDAMLIDPRPGAPEAFSALMKNQIAIWAKVAKSAGLKP